MTLSSFAALAFELGKAERDTKLAIEVALEKTCQLIEDSAKDAIGTYEFGWPPLAESTQEERTRLGFPADEPLLRTGRLRNSIGHYLESSTVGYVGTNDPNAKFHEYGTSKMPLGLIKISQNARGPTPRNQMRNSSLLIKPGCLIHFAPKPPKLFDQMNKFP